MGDIKLFRTYKDYLTELKAQSVAREKSLQNLIDSNLETFLEIQSETGISDVHQAIQTAFKKITAL